MRLSPAPPDRDMPDAGATLAPMARRRSAADNAYDSLRAAVISLALPPGTALSRTAIARRLGVSQTPVREALLRLQEEGLIAVVPQSATRVARIDIASAREAGFLRQALELAIVRRLAEAPPPGLEESLQAELARMRTSADEDGFTAADAAFHGVLYAAAGVPGLHELVRNRSGHLDRLRRLHLPSPGKAEAVLRQHAELAAAILRRQPAEAERLLRDHLSNTFAELARIRDRFPEFF